MRTRETFVYRCSGVPPRDGEPNTTQATACDRCLGDGDCTEQAGGKCVSVGGRMCMGPQRWECRYPSAACGGQICAEKIVPPPPSAPPRGGL